MKKKTREEILKVSMAQNRIDSSVNFTAITEKLEGFTGSDIKEVRIVLGRTLPL